MKKIIISVVCFLFAMFTLAVASANPFYPTHSSQAGESFASNGFWAGLPDGCYFELIHYFELQGSKVVVCRSKIKEVVKKGGSVKPTGKVWRASGAGSVNQAREVSGAGSIVLDFGPLGDGGRTKSTIAVLK
jgi:hypothetical protein